MADPLSLSASLAGLIALADSIFRASFKYAKSAKHAKEEASNLATEAQDLAGVLHRLSLRASALELEPNTDRPTLRLHHVISCRQLLLRVEKTLAKATADFDSSKSRSHLKAALKWPFSSTDTKQMLEEIARHRGTLTLALTADSMDALSECLTNQKVLQTQMTAIAEGIQQAREIATNIEMNAQKRCVLDFFLPVQPQQSLTQCLGLRHPMTGTWLVDGEDLQQWLAVPRSKLWLTGIPGAGKTVLAGAMITEVLRLSSNSTGVTFFFCEYKNQQSHHALNILQAVASQLALQNQAAYSLLEEYYKEVQPLHGLGTSLSLWKMKDVFEEMVLCFEKVYMIIDGLDECGDNAVEVASTLVSVVGDQGPAISLAFFSRDEYHIRQVLQDSFSRVDIAAHKEDVRLYVATEIASRMQQGKLRLRNMALKDEILHTLVDRNGGMFRWVTCQLDYLCELPRDKDRREALKTLPPTLNETYERILQRVEKKDHTIRRLVQRSLEYITAAYPPLTLSQLREAVSIEEDIEYLEEEDLFDEAAILQNCSSLIRVRTTGSKPVSYVEFSHFSVAEYLQGPSLSCSPNIEQYHTPKKRAERSLMTVCLRLILLKQMSYRPTATSHDVRHLLQRSKEYSLYPYASLFWFVFLRGSENDSTVLMLVKDLFSPGKSGVFLAWALEVFGCTLMSTFFEPDMAFLRTPYLASTLVKRSALLLEPNFTTLHMAALLGLSGVCRMLVKDGSDVNAMSTLGTPLHFAMPPAWLLPRVHPGMRVYQGPNGPPNVGKRRVISPSLPFHMHHQERPQIVQLFLDHGARAINSPLTAWAGKQQGLSLFIDALSTSVKFGNFNIIVKLLKAGMTLQLGDLERFQSVASNWAPPANISGTEMQDNLTRFLSAIKDLASQSEAAADLYPHALDFITSMPKHHEALGKGAPFAKSDSNETPLADPVVMAVLAVQSDNAGELEKIISGQRLDINRRLNSNGDTLLQLAVKNESVEAVRLLLGSGANPSIKDFQGRLPLWLCISDRHCQILSMMLDKHPADASTTDQKGNTIWHMVAENGSYHALRVLINRSSNLEGDLTLRNYDGHSPFAKSIKHLRLDHTVLMIDSYPKVVKSWTSKKSLLEIAAQMGSLELAQKLVETGLIDTGGDMADLSTPLHHIDSRASIGCVRFLKSIFPDVNTKDIHGARPLEAFVTNIIVKTASTSRGRTEGSVADIGQIVDELLPSDFRSVSDTGATFWEQFCSGIASYVAYKTNSPKRFGIRDARVFRWDSASLVAIVARLIEVGVLSAHETKRKDSSLYPFISTFAGNFGKDTAQMLTKTLSKALDCTRYLEDARISDCLVGVLHHAIRISAHDLVEALLARGVDCHKQVGGYNALQTACAAWSMTETKVFLLVLENTDRSTINNLTAPGGKGSGLAPIHLIGEGKLNGPGSDFRLRNKGTDQYEMFSRLVGFGADPNLCTASNVPAIVHFIKYRSTDLACHLLEHGADPSREDPDGYDAVTHAVLRGNIKFLARLRYLELEGRLNYKVQWGRVVNIRWDRKWRMRGKRTALAPPRPPLAPPRPPLAPPGPPSSYVGVAGGSQVDQLSHIPIFEECNALHLSALQGHTSVLEFYLQEGLITDINSCSKNGWTALLFAIHSCSTRSIRCLNKWGADMNPERGNGRPLLDAIDAHGKTKDNVMLTLIQLGTHPPRNWLREVSRHFTSRSNFMTEETVTSDDGDDWASDVSRLSNRSQGAPMPPSRERNVLYQKFERYGSPFDFPHLSIEAAIRAGNLEQFKSMWIQGQRDLACPDCSLISCAIRFSQPWILEWLIDNEEETDGEHSAINCPVHFHFDKILDTENKPQGIPKKVPWRSAADHRLNPILSKVLSHYLAQVGTPTILDEFPETPLITALRARNYAAVDIIINHVKENKEKYRLACGRISRHGSGANCHTLSDDPVSFLVNHEDDEGNNPLYFAIESGRLPIVRLLVENGADVNSAGPDSTYRPLHSAIRAHNLKIVEYLLRSGAYADERDYHGKSPLHTAVQEGQLKVLKVLHGRGADVHALDTSGNGVLIYCCRLLVDEWSSEEMEILLTLLGLGLNPDQPNGWQVTPTQILLPFHNARGLFLSRTLSIEWTPPINWKGYYATEEVWLFDDPKFHLLVRAVGKECLARVINLHPAVGDDYSPLCLAACYDSVIAMENLISVGADIEFEGSIYGTALMAACDHGRLSSVKFLVRQGARMMYTSGGNGDENARAIDRSAFHAAKRHPGVLEWLLVERHTEQKKITDRSNLGIPEACEEIHNWSGPVRARVRLSKGQRRQRWESSLDWLARVEQIRLDMDGKVVVGAELWPDLDTADAIEI